MVLYSEKEKPMISFRHITVSVTCIIVVICATLPTDGIAQVYANMPVGSKEQALKGQY